MALRDIGGDPAISALEAGLGDEDPEVRIKVMNSLGRIGDQRAIMWLGQAIMGDPEPEVRFEAVLALEGHKGGAVEAFITAAAEDDSQIVQKAAEWLAGRYLDLYEPEGLLAGNN